MVVLKYMNLVNKDTPMANTYNPYGSRLPFNSYALNVSISADFKRDIYNTQDLATIDYSNAIYILGGSFARPESFTDYFGRIYVDNPGLPKFSLSKNPKTRKIDLQFTTSEDENKMIHLYGHFKGNAKSIKKIFEDDTDVDILVGMNQ